MGMNDAILAYIEVQAKAKLKRLNEAARKLKEAAPKEDLKLLKNYLHAQGQKGLKGFENWEPYEWFPKYAVNWNPKDAPTWPAAIYIYLPEGRAELYVENSKNLIEQITRGLGSENPWTAAKDAADGFLAEFGAVADAMAGVLEEVLEGYLNDPARKELEPYARMKALQ